MPPPLLKAVGLTRTSLRDSRLLLDAVDLEVHAGECVAIVGPSGSGKTVLLRALAWLDPLDCGDVFFENFSPKGKRPGAPTFRRHVMYLHQTPWLPEGTVERVLRQPWELHGNRIDVDIRDSSHEQIAQWLDALGRKDSFLRQAAGDLSGGERQIVAMLRAMQLSPDVLLLDEPISALDAETQLRCEPLILKWLHAEDSRAIVIVTHDRQQAQRLADRILHMNAGRLEKPKA